MPWFAEAPANIALIKYMGKHGEGTNLPDNPSLSYTLNHLRTWVTLDLSMAEKDSWEPLSNSDSRSVLSLSLTLSAQERFLRHLSQLKAYFNYSGALIVRSANNFPQSAGLASSASSFAALTLCAVKAMCELTGYSMPSISEQASWSRLGSGSSCRSFFSPWVLWQHEKVHSIELPWQTLLHQVIIISDEEKKVSSSLAHQRVKTSPHYETRGLRAAERLQALLAAFMSRSWHDVYEICWHEFQDMHQLFVTCQEPFSYITPATQRILQSFQDLWRHKGDGPIVTMDAGPNIHLLYRPDQAQMAQQVKQEYQMENYHVL